MKVYMIRHKNEPTLYYKGTPMYGKFAKEGRIFRTLGQLRSFITSCMNDRRHSASIDSMVIVEFDLTEGATKEVHEIVTPQRLVKLLTK